ncbi:hypothetical protein [Marinobacterium lacunae]|uniref:hypothetical protein n=1 Tax=Marinobacterium lacunae TaxID=1232683 RepID=UPI000564C2FC|nr:hypothetical protein [Marinobacterium lacunae]
MARYILCLLFTLMSAQAYSDSDVEVVYAGNRFDIPPGFEVVGDLGGTNNILVFRYGREKGKNYIAFTDMTGDKSIEYGCSVDRFFLDLFSLATNTECNRNTMETMANTFVNDSMVDVWRSNHYVVNFSGDGKKTFLFLVSDDGKVIKIDSDFLDKDAYKKILNQLIK